MWGSPLDFSQPLAMGFLKYFQGDNAFDPLVMQILEIKHFLISHWSQILVHHLHFTFHLRTWQHYRLPLR